MLYPSPHTNAPTDFRSYRPVLRLGKADEEGAGGYINELVSTSD
jgi:hypothetical protein